MESSKLTMNGFLSIMLVVTLIIWIGTNDQVMGATTMDDEAEPTSPRWCVAKYGASEQALKDIIEWICAGRKVDCSPCREGGSCYEPDTLYRHASFLMNRYYQVNRQKGDCDFSGNGIEIEFEPSCGKCFYDLKSQ
ncbi:hypothetical protein C5167_003283 [Papaver somniferum]|uniref:X8 domain-containing protein n=1 Tax=Papaver somniferum TaxID=3469 RepID=A0A4Y7L484_PAPSO|nr:major pollen allergen Ole e 10-like [Papaver somniferum]RZC79059.1 hypothetical protein C5167_003283 [Papaver somniferum]